MRKFGIAAVFVFIIVPIVRGESRQEWTKPSSVQVSQDNFDGRMGKGSGTVIRVDKDGYDVLTCAHVVLCWGVAGDQKPLGLTWVKPAGTKEWYSARVIAYQTDHDLALLHISDSKAKVKASILADKESYENTKVVKCGYPGMKGRTVVASKCVGVRTGRWSFGRVQWTTAVSDVASESGDSGGGLFRDSDHAMVGVVWGAMGEPGGEWVLAATRVVDIHAFLEDVKKAGAK